MEENESLSPTDIQTSKSPRVVFVPLPYTETTGDVDPQEVARNQEVQKAREIDPGVKPQPGPLTTHDLSHFSSRTILTTWELYDQLNEDQKQTAEFIIPGENKDPSTADLEWDFLVNNRKIDPRKITTYPDLNGTLQQLEPIAKMQKSGKLGPVKVLAFEFHIPRAREIMDLLGIKGEIVEVEQAHTDYLKQHGATRVNRDELVNLPQVQEVKAKENGPIGLIWKIDKKLFGAKAPISRVLKYLTGSTVTNIKGYEGTKAKLEGKVAKTELYFPRFRKIKNYLIGKKAA